MQIIINNILPVIISISFPALIIVLLIKKPKVNNGQSLLYYANVTNENKDAKTLFESLEKGDIKPNYLNALLNQPY